MTNEIIELSSLTTLKQKFMVFLPSITNVHFVNNTYQINKISSIDLCRHGVCRKGK